jgi:hypothetical protein
MLFMMCNPYYKSVTWVSMMALEHVLLDLPDWNRRKVTQEFLLNKGTNIDQDERVTEFQPLSVRSGSRNNPGDISIYHSTL